MKCIENELENVSECDWVASKATAMDKVNGIFYNPRNERNKVVYDKVTDFLSCKFLII